MLIKSLLALVCMYLLSLSASAQIPAFYTKEPGKRKVSFPVQIHNNLVVLPVRINGKEDRNFLLDTGVKTNILFDPADIERLGLEVTRSLNLVGADGRTLITASVSPYNTIDLGEVEGIFQTILVLNENVFELESIVGVPIHGIIGYEFFKYNPVRISYDKKRIDFYRSDALRWRPIGFRKTAMTFDNGKPYIQAKVKQLDGVLPVKLLIDTGANHGLLLNRETSDRINLPARYIETDLGKSLGGDLYGLLGRKRRLTIEGLNFYDVITSFPDETEFSYVIKESGRQGSLGSEIFARLELIIDYRRERLLFKKAKSFSVPFEFDMSGIVLKAYPDGEVERYYVADLRADSPAAKAGIQVGDEIVSLNKVPVDFWNLTKMIDLLRSEPGKQIFMRVLRLGEGSTEENPVVETHEVNFILKREI